MRTLAPAKINWTLEVLGKREDGYHEIRSVMQTIDLCDEVRARRAPELQQKVDSPSAPTRGGQPLMMRTPSVRVNWSGDYDILDREEGANPWTLQMFRSARLLDPHGALDAEIKVAKNIPIAAGLGGGSSDAAAGMRLLDRLWALDCSRERLSELASEVGSDVTFFLYGGTALSEGRGERITPLPDAPTAWIVLLCPPIRMPEKTKRMYEAITADDFSDGWCCEVLSQRLQQARAVRREDLFNVFEHAGYNVFDGLERYRDALIAAGAEAVHLAGAGPAIFALAESESAARGLAERVEAPRARVFVTRTLTAQEATAVTD